MKELNPLNQAGLETPYHVTVRAYHRHPAFTMVAGLIATEALIFIVPSNTFTHFVGGAVYLVGALADNLSTVKAFDLDNRMNNLGIENIFHETSLCIGKEVKTGKDFLTDKKHLVAELLIAPIAVSLVPIGLALGALRAFTAFNNLQVSKRMNRAIEITKERS